MENLVTLVKIISVCIAAGLLGNWFADEVKKAKRKGDPPYKAYASTPGILIIVLIVLLPVLAWCLQR
ncbi:MAG: hypothetical protein Q7U02_10945 [Desulfosalsimonadaceae bacterium]|nr:hypothetical protein [Desulfosalsimonadaceae bacterium]